MELDDWMGNCWAALKSDGEKAGLRSDGFGDVASTDWTVLARLVYLATMRERARCVEAVRRARLSSGSTDEIIANINSGAFRAFPPKPAGFDGYWPSDED